MNLKSKFNKFSSRVSRKLGAYPGLRTYVLSLFYKKVVIDNKEEMMEELKRYTPPCSKEYGSSLCHNELKGGYDLQIIVPAYKVEKYIEDCVESVLSQNSRYNIMLTIVNDGSPDGTRDILRKYEHLPNVEIIDQENKGFSGARNTGLKVIKGAYLAFLDSDDMLTPGSIDALMDKMIENDADIVEGGYVTFRNNEEKECVTHKLTIGSQWLDVLSGYPWGKVYRASLFERLQFPEGYWFEDTMISFLVYPQSKKIVTIPDVVYRYRLNPNGISANYGGKAKSLDTLLITIQLLQEANILGVLNDEQMYDKFYRQLKINSQRIFSLRNSNLDLLVFRISCYLRNQYFSNRFTENVKYKTLENALDKVDFFHYLRDVIKN